MQAPRSSRVTYIVLRYMRRPLMVLITVYATSMLGWILIPGVDAEGNARNLSFFHAFYFLTYTVTTTGFGELPYAFTEAQRMWGIVSLYAGVIAWFYALGSIVGLVQNQDFQRSVAERRFAKQVDRITEPFSIVCGFGNTGALLTRGLTEAGLTVVVVDSNPERIKTLTLRDYRTEVAGLCGDARFPEHLVEAGLLKPNCKSVVALTQDEDVNLKISVSARLLNPQAWVVTQSTDPVHEDTLSTLGDQVHIIDPFQTYAKYLGATIHNPAVHTLNQWLAGTPDATLDQVLSPPRGTWILCGFGRMGHWIRDALEAEGIRTVMIDPHPSAADEALPNFIVGWASQENLLKAGVREAAGVVAGTNSDSDNLSILLNAKALNSELFTVVRQNRYRNQVLFQAAKADFIMMPGLVSARRILFLMIAPLMKPLFEALRDTVDDREGTADGPLLTDVMARLNRAVGGTRPRVWTIEINTAKAPAVLRTIRSGLAVTLGDLIRDPVDRDRHLACLPMVLQSDGAPQVMPDLAAPVRPGDQILLCGDARAHALLDATMNNEYTLKYLVTGRDETRGWALQWLEQKLAPTVRST